MSKGIKIDVQSSVDILLTKIQACCLALTGSLVPSPELAVSTLYQEPSWGWSCFLPVFISLHREKTVEHKYQVFSETSILPALRQEKASRYTVPWPEMVRSVNKAWCFQKVNDHFQQSGPPWVHTYNNLMTWIQESNDNWEIWLSTWILHNTLCRTFQASCSSYQKSKDWFFYQVEQRSAVLIKQRIVLQNSSITRPWTHDIAHLPLLDLSQMITGIWWDKILSDLSRVATWKLCSLS